MSKTKMLLDLVGSLRSVADDLEAICSCMMDSSPSPNAVPDTPATTPTTSPALSAPTNDKGLAPNERMDPVTGEITRLELPTLRAQAAAKAQTKEQKAQMKALLQKHGVNKLTELPLSDYFAFQEEVAAIV